MELLPSYMTGLFAVFLLTAFVKIVTTLSILRYGIGLHGAGFGVVIVGLSFVLSLLVMSSQLQLAGAGDLTRFAASHNSVSVLEKRYRPFLEQHAHADIKQKFLALTKRLSPKADSEKDSAKQSEAGSGEEVPFAALISAFLISELKEAFHLGFIILVPFLVIDLLVTNVLLAVGVTQLPHAVAALPLKILLFFAVAGWTLLSEKLVLSYVGGG